MQAQKELQKVIGVGKLFAIASFFVSACTTPTKPASEPVSTLPIAKQEEPFVQFLTDDGEHAVYLGTNSERQLLKTSFVDCQPVQGQGLPDHLRRTGASHLQLRALAKQAVSQEIKGVITGDLFRQSAADKQVIRSRCVIQYHRAADLNSGQGLLVLPISAAKLLLLQAAPSGVNVYVVRIIRGNEISAPTNVSTAEEISDLQVGRRIVVSAGGKPVMLEFVAKEL
jgi:hypothetical protein